MVPETPHNRPQRRPVELALLGLSPEVAGALLGADPTPHKEYVPYLVTLYRSMKEDAAAQLIREDLPKAKAYLAGIKALQGRQVKIPVFDAQHQPLTLPGLLVAIKPHLPKLADANLPKFAGNILGQFIRPARSGREAELLAAGEAELLYETDRLQLVRLNTYEASRHWGNGTAWCTAQADTREYFDRYNATGSLFVLVDREQGKKYQFHFHTSLSVNDENDDPVAVEDKLGLSDAAQDELDQTLFAGALADGMKKKYFPCLECPIPESLQPQALELAQALSCDAEINVRGQVSIHFLKRIPDLKAELQPRAMDVAERLAADKDMGVRAEVAREFLPASRDLRTGLLRRSVRLAHKLSRDPSPIVRKHLARRFLPTTFRLPPRFQKQLVKMAGRLARDQWQDVREQVANALSPDIHTLPAVLQLQAVGICRHLARDPSEVLRAAITQNLLATTSKLAPEAQLGALDIADRLADDQALDVCVKLAKNFLGCVADLPIDRQYRGIAVATKLATDESLSTQQQIVLQFIAHMPALAPQVQLQAIEIAKQMARYPLCKKLAEYYPPLVADLPGPMQVMAVEPVMAMAEHPEWSVRQMVAKGWGGEIHLLTPAAQLPALEVSAKLVQGRDGDIAHIAAENLFSTSDRIADDWQPLITEIADGLVNNRDDIVASLAWKFLQAQPRRRRKVMSLFKRNKLTK